MLPTLPVTIELLAILAAIGVALVVLVVVVVARRRALPAPPTPKAVEGEGARGAGEIARPLETAEERARREQRDRYARGLAQTRGGFVARLASIFKSRPQVTGDLKDEVETILFTADIGTRTAQKLIDRVSEVLDQGTVADPDKVWGVIRAAAHEILDLHPAPLDYAPKLRPYVLLMIGVNGVGKTTTLGKMAAMHAAAGRKVLLVAGDTFRAAATEQLAVWAERTGAAIHTGKEGADPSSVIHDGILRGRAEDFDVVLCDTAGRLHTKKELMAELGKVRRSCVKALARDLPEAEAAQVQGPHDTFLVLDATIGQNALAQAELFKETMDFTGLVLTKLDGTAKGGVVLGVCDSLRVPVRFVGIGERVDDLREFDPDLFVDALFAPADADA